MRDGENGLSDAISELLCVLHPDVEAGRSEEGGHQKEGDCQEAQADSAKNGLPDSARAAVAEIAVEVVLTARLNYRGIMIELKTDPGTYEQCRIKLLALVKEMKEAIDYAAKIQAEPSGQAGI
jgi:hypothetical protein